MTTVDTAPVPVPTDDFTPSPGRGPALRRDRLSLGALLLGTALLYLIDLGASGYANDFYAAAVQAGTKSWKAFFFGSFDASNFITVDKPPAALWPMEISGRLFGFNSWSMLVPQALEGVLTVWLLYATVKRWFGHWAGLLAGALLALTPVAVLMFRFNNPDALMTLLVVLAAYCTTRAIEAASTRWLLWAGLVMGFAFLAKGLQPFTVLPALGLAYLVAAPTSLRRRLLQLLGAAAAVLLGAGWWVLAVDLTPIADRPYIGGSGNNTALGLAFGYNGVSRLTGSAGPGGSNFSGSTGFGRLFNSLNGGQIAWLLPTALVAAVGLLAVTEGRRRTDRTSAAMIIWIGWLLVTGGVLSFAGGIIHTYYSVELAPAIAALVAIGAVELWRRRSVLAARLGLGAGAVVTGVWSAVLLHRTPSWHPWLGTVLVIAGVLTAALLLAPSVLLRRGVVAATVTVGVLTLGGGSAAYALSTAATPHTGSIPSAGPVVADAARAGGPGGAPRGARGGLPGFPGGGYRPGGALPGGLPGNGGRPGNGGLPGGPTGGRPGLADGGAPAGGPGGGATSVSSALVTLLKNSTQTWAAATVGSQTAAPLELASGKSVMSIGGFNGADAAPTLAQFEKLVQEGKIHYFVGSGGGGGGPQGSGSGNQIAAWLAQHYTAQTVGGTTVYDLTKAAQ